MKRHVAGVRSDAAEHGLCHWPYLGLPSASGGAGRTPGGRFETRQLPPYIIAPLAGGVPGVIARGAAGFDVSAGFASRHPVRNPGFRQVGHAKTAADSLPTGC